MKTTIGLFLMTMVFCASNVTYAQAQTWDTNFEINFDTTGVPNDELTNNIKILLKEIAAVEATLKVANSLIEEQAKKIATDERLKKFFKNFSTELQSEKVDNYYTTLFIRLYRKYYTNQEIIELTNFYKTPLGKKAFKNSLLIGNDAMLDATKFGEYLGQKVMAELE